MRCWQYLFAGLILVLFAASVNAQTYHVVYAKSQTKRFQSGRPILLGDSLQATEKLEMTNGSCKLVLWSKGEGFISVGPTRGSKGKLKLMGLIAELKEAQPDNRKLSERVGSLADLQKHFEKRRYLLLDHSWLLVDPKFRLTRDTVLFFQFESDKADLRVSRKVELHGDSLLFYPKYILDMNGKPVPAADASDFYLYWLDMRNKGYSALAKFEFIFADEAKVREEVARVMKILQTTGVRDREAVLAGVGQFLAAAYGVPDPHNLRQWMDRNFQP